MAIPGAPVFAGLVLLGELTTGAVLVCGFRLRLAAAAALLMVLNFHLASGIMFTYGYLTNGYGLPGDRRFAGSGDWRHTSALFITGCSERARSPSGMR